MTQSAIFKGTLRLMKSAYGEELAKAVYTDAKAQFERLCEENKSESKAVKTQTHSNLYPCISFYRSLQKHGINKQEALAFLDKTWSTLAESDAKSIRMLLKIPGLYNMMPKIFKKVTLSTFGEDAGFRATFYDLGKSRCKFDMTKCLYCDLCQKNGCPELVPCFCHTDDVTDGHMHKYLVWNRTKTMGEGADVCDFDLFIKKD